MSCTPRKVKRDKSTRRSSERKGEAKSWLARAGKQSDWLSRPKWIHCLRHTEDIIITFAALGLGTFQLDNLGSQAAKRLRGLGTAHSESQKPHALINNLHLAPETLAGFRLERHLSERSIPSPKSLIAIACPGWGMLASANYHSAIHSDMSWIPPHVHPPGHSEVAAQRG